MTIRYQPDHAGVGELMRSPEMLEMLEAKAQRGVDYARSIAPEATGEYRESLRVDSVRRGGPARDRAEARVVADSDHAAYVEWQDDYHVLARTAAFIEGDDG